MTVALVAGVAPQAKAGALPVARVASGVKAVGFEDLRTENPRVYDTVVDFLENQRATRLILLNVRLTTPQLETVIDKIARA